MLETPKSRSGPRTKAEEIVSNCAIDFSSMDLFCRVHIMCVRVYILELRFSTISQPAVVVAFYQWTVVKSPSSSNGFSRERETFAHQRKSRRRLSGVSLQQHRMSVLSDTMRRCVCVYTEISTIGDRGREGTKAICRIWGSCF